MRKRTLNTERRTSNAEWLVCEEAAQYRRDLKTFNVQRSTFNAQRKTECRFDLEQRLLEFSARIIKLVDALPNTRAGNHIAGQLLRCGTSPYGNHGEVQAAESRRDFVHKLRICLKELKETRRWLRLIQFGGLMPEHKTAPLAQETEELSKIFFASIKTAEKNAS